MYLIVSSIILLVWLLLFVLRKDVRKEMLFVSILVAIAGLFAELLIWTNDWWHPQTITNTIIGIEDFMYGFGTGGIAAIIYEEVFRRRHYKDVRLNIKPFIVVFPSVLFIILFFTLFFIFKLHSFYSNIFAYIVAIAIIYTLRKDLIIYSLLSGSLLTLVSMPFYWIAILLDPNIISNTWFLHELSGKLILGIPIEDLVWLYFTGLLIGPLYEFVFGYGVRKM